MRKQQVEKWKERNDEKERTRETGSGEVERWGEGHWARSIGQPENREERGKEIIDGESRRGKEKK